MGLGSRVLKHVVDQGFQGARSLCGVEADVAWLALATGLVCHAEHVSGEGRHVFCVGTCVLAFGDREGDGGVAKGLHGTAEWGEGVGGRAEHRAVRAVVCCSKALTSGVADLPPTLSDDGGRWVVAVQQPWTVVNMAARQSESKGGAQGQLGGSGLRDMETVQ